MSNQPNINSFQSLHDVAVKLRTDLEVKPATEKKKEKNHVLVYAYNGTGKTRLSMAFKNIGRLEGGRDTLYFNAFTEDLFTWHNDLDGDSERYLQLNTRSHFFDGLADLEMETRIRPLLHRYVDFDFSINTEAWTVHFNRREQVDGGNRLIEDIKVSRGEENIFIWCFFLAIAQLAIDEQESYSWVKYLYIDDPISSLDENNTIAVASHLAQLLKQKNNKVKVVISSHHSLFFNVMHNELDQTKKLRPYFLSTGDGEPIYHLRYTGDTPFFHHVAMLQELKQAAATGKIYTYHFNMLRSVLEKAATFHGFNNFSACIKKASDDEDGVIHARIINVLSHGNYSLFEPREMQSENKDYFRRILNDFMEQYKFNPELFPEELLETIQP